MTQNNRNQLVTIVASAGHQQWREQYRAANGNAPRIKKTNDQAFLDRGVSEVDIASLSYEELPSDWQAENKAGGEVAVDEVLKAVQAGKPLDADFIEAASAVQHDEWLKRNGSYAPPAQKLPYDELTEDEKEKDRFFVREAIAAYQA